MTFVILLRLLGALPLFLRKLYDTQWIQALGFCRFLARGKPLLPLLLAVQDELEPPVNRGTVTVRHCIPSNGGLRDVAVRSGWHDLPGATHALPAPPATAEMPSEQN